jgi:uncharacterized protein YprB with RNaseH-like and TPR domain
MLKILPIEKILFLDIETVPQAEKWEDLTETEQKLWEKKTLPQRKDEISAEDFYRERAGVMAEFGKIICISVGMTEKNGKLKIRSFYGHGERKLLLEFAEIFNNQRLASAILCAHNGKEFDFPWLSRRMLINGITPPAPLQMYGKKPWEIPHLDTMELWKFGDWKSFVSLDLLAHIFGVPSSKDSMDGSMVADEYYKKDNLDGIVTYCEKDVLTLANVFQRMRQEEVLERS